MYNRGNDKQTIFFQERNYDFFLQKVEKYIAPDADLVAWCLMPNHFHLLIQANSHDSIRQERNC
jgi:putative transposase